jgi:hypothetical protein
MAVRPRQMAANGSVTQFEMARNEVGVEVREKT